jgi:hypothetical protein
MSAHRRPVLCRVLLPFACTLLAIVVPALLRAQSTLQGTQQGTQQGTHLWTQSQLAEFEKGTSDGVALTSDGHIAAAPGVRELAATASTFVWSVTTGKNGAIYLATGSPATVLRIDQRIDAIPAGKMQTDKQSDKNPSGKKQTDKPFTLFESKDVSVQSLRLGPDGSLYAATLPSGRVYRLNPAATAKQDEATATLVFDPAKLKPESPSKTPHPRYIWDLAFDTAGRLLIATGDPAAIYRVDLAKPNAQPEEFFHTDEAHIRALAWDAKGNLLAGTDGSGLVYRIDSAGKGYVLFEAPRREITALAVDAAGAIYAACVGDKNRNPLPSPLAQGLLLQALNAPTINIAQPASLPSVNASATLPDGSEIFALSGAQALSDTQAPRKLWAARDEIVYALASTPDGLLALTGNHGRLFRIQPDGSYALLAQINAQQALAFTAAAPNAPKHAPQNTSPNAQLLIAAGNPGRLYALESTAKHEYASSVFDAGALARFGRIEIEPGSIGVTVLTRSGNVEQPTRGWTDWLAAKDGVVASPPGRYLQWKLVLEPNGTTGSIAVNWLAVNAAPVLDDVVVVPGARLNAQGLGIAQSQTVSIAFPSPAPANNNLLQAFDPAGASAPLQAAKDRASVTARWAAHDDNGDELTFALYLRGDGESRWRLLKDKLTEKAYSFDATEIPDGGYQLKVVASDAPSHTPADALTAEKISPRFEVDTTAPVIAHLRASSGQRSCAAGKCTRSLSLVFDAEDATSPIHRAEVSLDAGPWQFVEPVGKLSDARREHYDLQLTADETSDLASAKPEEHLITVRVFDRHDNVGLAKTVVSTEVR